jgi:predicted ATPase
LGRAVLADTFPPGWTVETPDVPCLFVVGDNGSGKSTLLECAKHQSTNKGADLGMKLNARVPVRALFWFSDNNPIRHTHGHLDDMAQIAAMFQSHGQVQGAVMQQLPEVEGPGILFIDEPESGLSLPNQINLAHWLETWVEAAADRMVVLATHSYLLISRWGPGGTVLDLDARPAELVSLSSYRQRLRRLIRAKEGHWPPE